MVKNVPCIFERLFPGQRCVKHYVSKKKARRSTKKTKKVA